MAVFNPLSLYDLCKDVCIEDFDVLKLKPLLPRTVYNAIFEKYVYCDEICQYDEFWIKYLEPYDNIILEWNLEELNDDQFLYLMNLPEDVPTFALESNHIWEHYYDEYDCKTDKKTMLCSPCFTRRSKFYTPDSENRWEMQNVVYFEYRDHLIVDGTDLLAYIWDPKHWCKYCYKGALFKVYDEDDCRYMSNLHTRKRSIPDSDYSTDDDSDIDVFEYKKVKGNSIPPLMYHFLN